MADLVDKSAFTSEQHLSRHRRSSDANSHKVSPMYKTRSIVQSVLFDQLQVDNIMDGHAPKQWGSQNLVALTEHELDDLANYVHAMA